MDAVADTPAEAVGISMDAVADTPAGDGVDTGAEVPVADALMADTPADGISAPKEEAAEGDAAPEGEVMKDVPEEAAPPQEAPPLEEVVMSDVVPQEVVTAPAEAPAVPVVVLPNPLLDAYNKIHAEAIAATNDFNAWTSLITAAEKLDDLEQIRATYDSFLESWPLCYGYWKKYAEAEARHGSSEKATAVYERGCKATPTSVDIWLYYANYCKSLPEAKPEDVRRYLSNHILTSKYHAHARSIYERAVAAVGTDYLAHSVWDKFLAFEEEQGNKAGVVALYEKVIALPTRDLDKYAGGLKAYIGGLELVGELATEEAAAALKDAVRAERKLVADAAQAKTAEAALKKEVAEADAAVKAAAAEAAASAPPPEPPAEGAEPTEPPPPSAAVAAEAARAATAAATAAATDAAVIAVEAARLSAIAEAEVTDDEAKAKWMEPREARLISSRDAVSRIRSYEEGIKRAYFHVKALDAPQLSNWAKYLDFLEAAGDDAATVTVYERCLVPCAAYPEFWMRYVRWLETAGRRDAAVGAVARATATFCRTKPEIFMFAMLFDERRGDADAARGRYKHVLDSLAPWLMSAIASAAYFERRQGNRVAACALFEALLERELAKEREAPGSTGRTPAASFVAMQYANFLRGAYKDYAKGRAVLADALSVAPQLRSLWEAAIQFEELAGADDMVDAVVGLCARAVAPPAAAASGVKAGGSSQAMGATDREELSQRGVDFAEAFGTPAQIAATAAAHAKTFPGAAAGGGAADGRKRDAPDAQSGGQRPAKAARTDVGGAYGVGAPASMHAGGGAAYGGGGGGGGYGGHHGGAVGGGYGGAYGGGGGGGGAYGGHYGAQGSYGGYGGAGGGGGAYGGYAGYGYQ
ncbi:hypothetical protein FOA52_004570 [Chlamydomonas sp. UWO 241]|nr:hypothetical protein FOA52_004570 [Chlamydomonas sp. UWO 241]